MKLSFLPYISVLSACFLLAPASAGAIFTWVDKDGVTHFSESPPENGSVKARQIEVEPAPVVGNTGEDDYFSVVRQLERMQQRRLENERAKLERLQAETAARQAEEAAEAETPPQEDLNRPAPALVYPVPVPVPVHPPHRDQDRHRDGRDDWEQPPPYTRNPKYKPDPEHEPPRRPRPHHK